MTHISPMPVTHGDTTSGLVADPHGVTWNRNLNCPTSHRARAARVSHGGMGGICGLIILKMPIQDIPSLIQVRDSG